MLRSAVLFLHILALCGCLPLPIDEDLPQENFPPFYAADRVAPPYERLVDYDAQADGPLLLFELVDYGDPNETDRLFWRWYVDYSTVQSGIASAGPAAGLSPQQRGAPISMTLTPCGLSGQGLHRIDLIVADRAFVSSTAEASSAPNHNQALPDGAGSFRLTWFVSVDSAGCR